jgi:hypothetical protein
MPSIRWGNHVSLFSFPVWEQARRQVFRFCARDSSSTSGFDRSANVADLWRLGLLIVAPAILLNKTWLTWKRRCAKQANFRENLLDFARFRAFKKTVKYCGLTIITLHKDQMSLANINWLREISALNLSVKRICYN